MFFAAVVWEGPLPGKGGGGFVCSYISDTFDGLTLEFAAIEFLNCLLQIGGRLKLDKTVTTDKLALTQ